MIAQISRHRVTHTERPGTALNITRRSSTAGQAPDQRSGHSRSHLKADVRVLIERDRWSGAVTSAGVPAHGERVESRASFCLQIRQGRLAGFQRIKEREHCGLHDIPPTLRLFEGSKVRFCLQPVDLPQALLQVIRGRLELSTQVLPKPLVVREAPLGKRAQGFHSRT